jgi:heavy metal sensor kinase
MSIRARLTAWYALTLALALAVVAVVLLLIFRGALQRQLDGDLGSRAAAIVAAVQPDEPLALQHQDGDVTLVATGGELVALYDPAGNLTDASARPSWLGASVAAFATAATTQRADTLTVGSEHVRMLALPIVVSGRRIGTAVVMSSLAPLDAAERQLLTILAITLPIAVVLVALGGYVLAVRALAPVEQLRSAAEEYRAHELSRRLAPRQLRDDELGRLARTLDAMLDRVAAAVEQQRRFTGDASHELRTPIATVLAEASLALERARTSPEYEATLQRIQSEAVRMGRLVDGLLVLARADEPNVGHTARVDLSALVRDAVDRAARRAEGRTIEIDHQLEPGVTVVGDPSGLERVVENLIENAVRYAADSTSIEVTARASDMARVAVIDHGPGIPASERAKIFERFHRAPGARGNGAGLGLAIAHSIVLAHGGQISVAETAGGGATFIVELPVARPGA